MRSPAWSAKIRKGDRPAQKIVLAQAVFMRKRPAAA
jgi:hypothetical protein